jgi:inositol transport system substrate-binding protein
MKTSLIRSFYAALLPAACFLTSVSTQAKDTEVAVSLPNLAWAATAFMGRCAQDEGKKLGVNVVLIDAQGDTSKEASDLRGVVTRGVDGIVIEPVDEEASASAIDDIMADKIPLVTFCSVVKGTTKPTVHFGANQEAVGAAMAEALEKKFSNGGKFIFLDGEPGSGSAVLRAKGFFDAIEKVKDKYQLVARQTAKWQRPEGLRVTQNILTSLGYQPDAIVSANDDMALGAIEALRSENLSAGKVTVIGCDAMPDALNAVKDGWMYATVDQRLGGQVRTALDAMTAFLRDKRPLTAQTLAPVIVTSANISDAEQGSVVK